jgi:hypothetical protein
LPRIDFAPRRTVKIYNRSGCAGHSLGIVRLIGVTRDDCRTRLHGETRERDGYQHCAFCSFI